MGKAKELLLRSSSSSCLRKEAVAGLKLYPWDIVLPRIKGKETPMDFYQSKQAALRHPEI